MGIATPSIEGRRSITGWTTRRYWVATGLFCAVFVFSGVWSIVDPDGARATMERLGFPTFFLYPQAVAKLAGVAVILLRRWRPLTDLAFAGFLYDVLLAGGAHLENGEPDVFLAAGALMLWAFAFWAYHWRFPAPPLQ